jgi:hypothetical protein
VSGSRTRFHYLSPIILPVLPERAGALLFSLNLSGALDDVAAERAEANLTCRIQLFEAGTAVRDETLSIPVTPDGPATRSVDRRFSLASLGYAEISITADRPYFRKILTEHMYSIVERPDGGTYIINGAYKFSDPLIINLMRRVGRFCLVHPAHFVSRRRNIGNSTIVVNPFDGSIVARLRLPSGTEIRRRVPPHEATMIDLHELIADEQWSCVLYTGNNRYPAWDVRNRYDDPLCINRIDHLEYYRSDPTVRFLSTRDFLRSQAGRVARSLGLRA